MNYGIYTHRQTFSAKAEESEKQQNTKNLRGNSSSTIIMKKNDINAQVMDDDLFRSMAEQVLTPADGFSSSETQETESVEQTAPTEAVTITQQGMMQQFNNMMAMAQAQIAQSNATMHQMQQQFYAMIKNTSNDVRSTDTGLTNLQHTEKKGLNHNAVSMSNIDGNGSTEQDVFMDSSNPSVFWTANEGNNGVIFKKHNKGGNGASFLNNHIGNQDGEGSQSNNGKDGSNISPNDSGNSPMAKANSNVFTKSQVPKIQTHNHNNLVSIANTTPPHEIDERDIPVTAFPQSYYITQTFTPIEARDKNNSIEIHFKNMIYDTLKTWQRKQMMSVIILSDHYQVALPINYSGELHGPIKREGTRKVKLTTYFRVIQNYSIGVMTKVVKESLKGADGWIFPKFSGMEHVYRMVY